MATISTRQRPGARHTRHAIRLFTARAAAPLTRRTLAARLGAVLLSASFLVTGGCDGDKPPTEPGGGVQAFTEALASGDSSAVFGRLSEDTRAVCEHALVVWQETDSAIDQLQASDQGDARVATGTGMLERIDTPEALFEALTDITAIPPLSDNNRYRSGLREQSTVPVAADTVIVVTRSGQEFEMVLSDDGEWRVREPFYSLLNDAVANLHTNRERVAEAVQMFGLDAEIDEELRALGLLE